MHMPLQRDVFLLSAHCGTQDIAGSQMSVEIKLEKHPQSDGTVMYSAAVWEKNRMINATIVADTDRGTCIEKCRRMYEVYTTVDLEPEWIALEA